MYTNQFRVFMYFHYLFYKLLNECIFVPHATPLIILLISYKKINVF